MRLKFLAAAVAASLILALSLVSANQSTRQAPAAVPTFTKDVAPILFRNCTGCHRPGEIAPMSLLTYEDARPYARAILEELEAGHMPPWHAEAPEGTFVNERRLPAADKNTILKWASGGAPRGNPADMPKAPAYPEGWAIGKPDQILEMTEPFAVPASGTIAYEYAYIPANFTEAKWIKAIEVRPGVRAVVHHVLVYYKAKPDAPRGPALLVFNQDQMRLPRRDPGRTGGPRNDGVPRKLIGTYAPGTNPQVLPAGTAIRLEPGGELELQMHYTATGQAVQDRTKVGLIFATESSPREVRVSNYYNAQFTLPAGAADVKVSADVGFAQETTLWGLFPHTHLRGKKWQYVLELPDGTKKVVLDVPRYDFNWQTYYMFREPLQIPAGARLVSHAWYDNSAKNPANPDAKVDVHWGDQTWEEMQYTGLLVSPAPAAKAPTRVVR
jgi:hypothetical protein